MTAYVHEGVHITVDPYAGVEVHEAADALVKFRDKCIFPETMEMLNDILVQIDDPVPDVMDLKTVLDRTINDWFYMWQERLGIKDGAEPLDSNINELKKNLAQECERVLEWQNSYVKPDNTLLTQFYNTFDLACCTCSGNKVTSYDLSQHCGDAPVEGFFEAWDSMVQSIKDNSRDSVLYYGHKLHSLINSMDTSIYDYKHGTWIDDYINWYLEEVK
jgi:hypothetical protein